MPKVSIAIPTYNSEKYLLRMLESIFMQTYKNYEIVIIDDGSTDNTREILSNYKDKIKYIYQSNQGVACARHAAISNSQGEYIALMDSDDYWISPLKLQKQVDVLDKNPSLSICFHDALVLWENKKFKPSYFCSNNQKKISDIYDVINEWFIPTASLLFRKKMLEIPAWFSEMQNEDYALQMLLADKGKILYINEVMSVYTRRSSGGFLNDKNINDKYIWEQKIKLFIKINEYFGERYTRQINNRIQILRSQLRKMKLYNKYPFLKYFNMRKIKKRILRILNLKYNFTNSKL